MDLTTFLFWSLFLINTNTITATDTNSANTIDVLQNQLNQILVQFCASEIDRNKTASAILKFGQLPNATLSIKEVVQFYTENYEESFDNLLHFIDHISSVELQLLAYNTLIDAMNSDVLNVINVLSFENFIRMKFEFFVNDDERSVCEDLLSTIGNHLKKLIVSIDLNALIKYINSSSNPARIFDLIPTIVQGINLNNFTDVNKIFEFSMQLPRIIQLKLIRKVLSKMRETSQYQHLFHVISQIRLLRRSVNSGGWIITDICLLSQIETEIPEEIGRLLVAQNYWFIKSLSLIHALSRSNSQKYNKNLLFVGNEEKIWLFETQSYNSVRIRDSNNYNEYLTVEYCFHNESFPTMTERDSNDLTQINWYFIISDDLTYVQIKNIYTNELLISEEISESDGSDRHRVTLSRKCSHCDSSKWSLKLYSAESSDMYSRYSCPRPNFIEH